MAMVALYTNGNHIEFFFFFFISIIIYIHFVWEMKQTQGTRHVYYKHIGTWSSKSVLWLLFTKITLIEWTTSLEKTTCLRSTFQEYLKLLGLHFHEWQNWIAKMKRKTIDFLINKKIKNYQREFDPHFTHVFRKSTYLPPRTPSCCFQHHNSDQ